MEKLRLGLRLGCLIFVFVGATFRAVSIEVKPFCFFSFPKCGTHLMRRILKLVTGLESWGRLHPTVQEVRGVLSGKGKFLLSHCYYGKKIAKEIEAFNGKIIVTLRHPLDQVVSHARWIHRPGYPIWPKIKHLPLNTVVTDMITSSKWRWESVPNRYNLVNFYDLYLPWLEKPYVHIVRYEELIGGENGDLALRKLTIKGICDFLEIPISEEKLKTVAIAIDQTQEDATYTPGNKIGRWKDYLTGGDIKLFREIGGDLLMERLNYSY